MTTRFLVFAAPDIQDAELAAAEACLRSGWLGTRPRVKRFEADFASYKGLAPEQVAGVNSCTAVMHMSMMAIARKHGLLVIEDCAHAIDSEYKGCYEWLPPPGPKDAVSNSSTAGDKAP